MPGRGSRPSRAAGRAGFSLIEVLVAFTIASIMLLAFMQAMSRGLGGIESAERQSRLLAAAENVLADVGVRIPLDPGDYSGEIEGFAWRVRVAELDRAAAVRTNAERLGLGLVSVEVSVEGDGNRRQRLSTLRLAERTQ